MRRYHLHVLLSVPTAGGLLAIAAVTYRRFGVDLYTLGFLALGLLGLYRVIPSLVLPDRFDRPRVSRQQLLLDVVGVVLVAVVLYLFVFEQATIGDYIAV
ncbi:hypothetical protein [Halapricum salinum]|uniref:Uncharacterized protein n=1 Tax=Halapricum salinum TaxID=1457250 RepID=A0A4D6HHW9_9EURY|nr:hypothetical protein [Halapricum salinum]QCC52612.1 hypothetical protein DV733_15850 [Halapricum salinum]